MNFFKKPTTHIIILLSAFLAALAFRLIRLGVMPLNNLEASIALQALSVSQNMDVIFGEHMTYVGFTGLDFFIFDAGNFLARLWPAVFGALIVFVPVLFRNHLGYWQASVLAVVLAITPEMVGLSRLVGSPMIAFVNLFFSFGLLLKKKPILSGLTFALALMGGSGFWAGITIVGIAILLSKLLMDYDIGQMLFDAFTEGEFPARFFISWLLTIAVVGTGFFLSPEGLSGVFSGLVSFIRGFTVSYTNPYFLRSLALIAYSLPALVFGLWGGIRAVLHGEKLDIFLFILASSGLLYLLIYPGATPADIIWVTLPLWALSARVVCSVWRLPEGNRLVMTATAAVVVVVFAFLLLSLRSLVNPNLFQDAQLVTLIALFGGFVLLIGLVLLVTFGWSEEVALAGLLIGLSLVVMFGLVSTSTRTMGLNFEDTNEIWYPEEANLSTRWLQVSTDRVLEWNERRADPLEIVVVDNSTPGMRWAMQDYDDVSFVPNLPAATQPGILISDIMTQPEISNSYRGQDLVWSRKALWREMSAMQYLNWLLTRDAPVMNEEIIFWVRTDLMPDEQFSQ